MNPTPTAAVADALVRLRLPVRSAPAGLHPLRAGMVASGPAVPVRHAGSVDVFLEALRHAPAGGVLVVDNGGRMDEACLGDLAALEALHHRLAAVVVWGLHRDTAELRDLGVPAWSLGSIPAGPREARQRPCDALERARVGDVEVTDDWVFADDDGVVFVPTDHVGEVTATARSILERERAQADAVRDGRSLAQQFDLASFLERREREPAHTFRAHLRTLGGAIEE